MKTNIKVWTLVLSTFGFLLLLNGCNKDEKDPTVPILSTENVSDITLTTATSGGNITSDGGTDVTARGVCWSLNPTPSITGNKTTDGLGTGSFNSTITELTPSSTYYVRAYATNSVGTAYGNEITFSCASPVAPTITTTQVSLITLTKAQSGGNVSSNGGAIVIERGICFGLAENPTITDTKIISTGTTGAFSCSLTGLTSGTLYHLRAYATNSAGTSYGSDEFFSTVESTVTDIDGNVYNAIEIGNQVWMKENLKTTKYRDGVPIPNVTDKSEWNYRTTAAYCFYNNDAAFKDAYGVLYNYYAVIDSHKLCPLGWHVPSNAEWSALIKYLDLNSNPNNYPESSTAGAKLMSKRIDPEAHPRWNIPNHFATNESDFSGLPAGARFLDGFVNIGFKTHWWSITENGQSGAWDVNIFQESTWACKNYYYKEGGFSVRCLKD